LLQFLETPDPLIEALPFSNPGHAHDDSTASWALPVAFLFVLKKGQNSISATTVLILKLAALLRRRLIKPALTKNRRRNTMEVEDYTDSHTAPVNYTYYRILLFPPKCSNSDRDRQATRQSDTLV